MQAWNHHDTISDAVKHHISTYDFGIIRKSQNASSIATEFERHFLVWEARDLHRVRGNWRPDPVSTCGPRQKAVSPVY